MSTVTLEHFTRAAIEIGSFGDNDTLPFDIDNRFIKENHTSLATLAYSYFGELDSESHTFAAKSINALHVFSERLLVPTGSAGFRISTKIHPFWNIYINGIGVAIAEANEPQRSVNAHSYRYTSIGHGLFDRTKSWRAYREATLNEPRLREDNAVVVQTDISSFYEHIYHHRLENCLKDLFPPESTVAVQIDRFLSKFASGRSFGLPVGGQCARILAEVMMSPIDNMLHDAGIVWHRYVDDFTIITDSRENAYQALAVLSHALADYGLSLNRTKTTVLGAKHYMDFVRTQLGASSGESSILREIDLHFDPYSDSPTADYEKLRDAVQSLDVHTLLELETVKGHPDTFMMAQIGRTLRFQSPTIAIQLCKTLLEPKNLNAFRASWSKIMRGIASVRAENDNRDIFDELDELLDRVPIHSPHLLMPEINCLHYLKTVRFRRTTLRAQYVLRVYNNSSSETVKRACIECWRLWGRPA
ncbi:MAG: RNA-directed DNA polymerase [Rhodospirillaceae bacterium]|nr:RNA-directed DNA polymerase [Rhodospirillaceae bacterium]